MRKQYHELDDTDLARICHEAHLALRIGLNDSATDVHWDALPQKRKDLVISEVRLIRSGKMVKDVHQAWVDHQLADGWELGERDIPGKKHPNLVPYHDLPEEEQAKVRQAFRIVFTHVIPEALEDIAYSDIRTRTAADEITLLGQELDLSGSTVCVTHMRFAPCRGQGVDCIYSETRESIEEVMKYQAGR